MSKNPPSDGFACLMRLRAELQQCPPNEFEQRRGLMLALLDNVMEERIQQNKGQSETIQMLSDAFLGGVRWGKVTSEGELSAEAFGRHAELLKEVTGLDAVSLLWLFYQLESKAMDWIKALSALAQTTKPASIGKQCELLPVGLIHNADKALKADKSKGGSVRGLPPGRLEEFRKDYAKWRSEGSKAVGEFDTCMGEKYGRSAKAMARYRKEAAKISRH